MSLDPASLNDMTGLHALITGAGTGIGLNIARTYAAHGATVYLVGRRLEKLEEAKVSVEKVRTVGSVVVLQGDVSHREGIDGVLAAYKEVSGTDHLDVLVANAGIFRLESETWSPDLDAQALGKQIGSSTFEDWNETISINTASFYLLTGAFVPLLAKSNDGNVIVTSSIAGIHWSAKTSNPSYAASKVATNHLTKILANRLAGLYIRVNAIAPGMFPSEINNEESQARLAPAIAKIPAKRMGNEADMGQTAVFLAMCSYVDAQILVVDGGRTLAANGE